MAKVKQWILDWARESGTPKIIMLDDDLTFCKRSGTGQILKAEQFEVEQSVKWIYDNLDV